MRALIIDMILMNPGIKYSEVATTLEINYENVRKIWHTYRLENRRTKFYSKKFRIATDIQERHRGQEQQD